MASKQVVVEVPVEVPGAAIPQLTNDQKLAIRESQVAALKFREQSRQLQDRAAQIDQQIAQYINKTASDMKVDPKVYSFDIDQLVFHLTQAA
jgi:hypothetical protein